MTKNYTMQQGFICVINISDDMNIYPLLTGNIDNSISIITKIIFNIYITIDKSYNIVYNILCRMYQMITFFSAAEFRTLRRIGI